MSVNLRKHIIVSKPDPKNTDILKLADVCVVLMDNWERAMQLIYFLGRLTGAADRCPISEAI
jgi:hypothetical protein